MRCTALLALSVVLAGVLAAPRSAVAVEPTEIQVYAAESLRNVLEEMAPAVERATGTRLIFNLGASNDLARQIVAANKADVFFSADEGWMDRVAGAGLIDLASRRSPLSNRLVVVVPQESALAIASAAVRSAAVDAGIVYRTDAAVARRARVAFVVPEKEGPRISYAIAALGQRPHLTASRAVVAWLASDSAAPYFERAGFVIVRSAR